MSTFYGTIAGADTYHSERGNIAWATYDTTEKEAALLRASDWLDGTYRTMFSGEKVGQRAQVREWPRVRAFDIYGYVLPSDTVPREVDQATYELALREAASPGVLDVDFTAADAILEASVEDAVSVKFGGTGSIEDAQLAMPVVDKIIAPLLTAQGGSISSLSGRMVRT